MKKKKVTDSRYLWVGAKKAAWRAGHAKNYAYIKAIFKTMTKNLPKARV